MSIMILRKRKFALTTTSRASDDIFEYPPCCHISPFLNGTPDEDAAGVADEDSDDPLTAVTGSPDWGWIWRLKRPLLRSKLDEDGI